MRYFLWITFLILISSCAKVNYKTILDAKLSQGKKIILVNFVKQPNLVVKGMGSDYDRSGLYLNDLKSAEYRNSLFIPIIDSLAPFNINTLLKSEYTPSLSDLSWLPIDSDVSAQKYKQTFEPIGSLFVFSHNKYELTNNLDSLEVTMVMSIKEVVRYKMQGKRRVHKFKNIFRSEYKFVSNIFPEIKENEKNSKRLRAELVNWYENENEKLEESYKTNWQPNNELSLDEKYRAAVKDVRKKYTGFERVQIKSNFWKMDKGRLVKNNIMAAITEIKKMIFYDLVEKYSIRDEKRYSVYESYREENGIVGDNGSRLLIENDKNRLCSIPKNASLYRCSVGDELLLKH